MDTLMPPRAACIDLHLQHSLDALATPAACLASFTPSRDVGDSPGIFAPLPSLQELGSSSLCAAFMANSAPAFPGWYFNSGASHHMTSNASLFTSMQQIRPEAVHIAGGKSIYAASGGTACIGAVGNTGPIMVDLKGSLYVPLLPTQLISILRLLKQGQHVLFTQSGGVEVLNASNVVIARGISSGGLFRLVQPPQPCALAGEVFAFTACIHTHPLTTWHCRFAHLNVQALQWLANSGLVSSLGVERDM